MTMTGELTDATNPAEFVIGGWHSLSVYRVFFSRRKMVRICGVGVGEILLVCAAYSIVLSGRAGERSDNHICPIN